MVHLVSRVVTVLHHGGLHGLHLGAQGFLAAVVVDQGQFHLFTGLERRRQVYEHDMQAAGLEHGLSTGRNVDFLHLAHAMHAVVAHHMGVQFHHFGRRAPGRHHCMVFGAGVAQRHERSARGRYGWHLAHVGVHRFHRICCLFRSLGSERDRSGQHGREQYP